MYVLKHFFEICKFVLEIQDVECHVLNSRITILFYARILLFQNCLKNIRSLRLYKCDVNFKIFMVSYYIQDIFPVKYQKNYIMTFKMQMILVK